MCVACMLCGIPITCLLPFLPQQYSKVGIGGCNTVFNENLISRGMKFSRVHRNKMKKKKLNFFFEILIKLEL